MRLFFTALAASTMIVAGFSAATPAQAAERLTLYEVNKFVRDFDQAMSSQDSVMGQSFLMNNVMDDARFETTVRVPRVSNGDYGNVYYRDQTYGVYYRYPYPAANEPYTQQVSSYYDDKPGAIEIFQNKKIQIPGYAQKTVVEGFTMPASATEAAVDVIIREYGARYSLTFPGLIESALQSHSLCRMYLKKKRSAVKMTGLSCETTAYYAGAQT